MSQAKTKELELNVQGNLKQLEAVKYWTDKTTIDIAYGGSKGSGKSFLGCSLLSADALIYPETHYFVARKTLTDLRKFTIPSFHEVFSLYGIDQKYYKYNGQDNYFQFYNGSKIFLIDAKLIPSDPKYMRFGSMQMTRGWIEESGEFEEECKNNLQASIGRWKNKEYNLTPKLLQTCNPAKNYLYRDYYKTNLENKLPDFRKFIQALPSDNKMLPPEYIPNLLKILSPNEIQRLVYGFWEFDDNPYALFDYNDILNIFTNEFIKPNTQRYLTCDIAYTGSDKFVLIVWDGLVIEKIIAIDKIDDTAVSKKINDLRIEYRVPLKNVIYDADGLQTFTRNSAKSGVLSNAQQFNNGGKPIKIEGKLENYKNLKAQCYFLLADYVKDNKIYIREKDYRKQIIEELEQINRLPFSDDGKLALEKKDLIKERLGRSPDFADAIMMRMYYEIKGKQNAGIIW
jgi:phage terminase large subunit